MPSARRRSFLLELGEQLGLLLKLAISLQESLLGQDHRFQRPREKALKIVGSVVCELVGDDEVTVRIATAFTISAEIAPATVIESCDAKLQPDCNLQKVYFG